MFLQNLVSRDEHLEEGGGRHVEKLLRKACQLEKMTLQVSRLLQHDRIKIDQSCVKGILFSDCSILSWAQHFVAFKITGTQSRREQDKCLRSGDGFSLMKFSCGRPLSEQGKKLPLGTT